MSLILDALNKSEQERPENRVVPGLQTMHEVTEATGGRSWQRFAWPAVALVCALVAISAWLTRPAQTPVPPALQTAQPLVQVRELPMQELPVQEPSPANAPELLLAKAELAPAPVQQSPAGGNVAALYVPVSTVTDTPAKTPTIAPAGAAQPQLDPEPEVSALPIDVDAVTEAARQALAERPAVEPSLAEQEIPLIVDLKQNIKDDIPSLFFTSHRWTSTPGDSEVMINGKTYHEGDRVKPGLTLLQIFEDSIVLDYRGTEFRLRSLNSWVNL
jgi:general secretion pathway protein B